MSLAVLGFAAHFTERRSSQAPRFRALGEGFMKDISTILLASVFVLFSLIVLLSAARTPDRTSWTLDNDQQRVSDLGLRFAFKR
jgi:cellobiose-specific phosphotransferase system component IIC